MKAVTKTIIIFSIIAFVSTPSTLIAKTQLNINVATIEELQTLPGIGPVIAKRIIDYRKKHGMFESVEEIMKVKGIGKKKFQKIKNLITVNE